MSEAEAVLTPDGFAQALEACLEAEISVYPARAWYPSALGHPCDRYLVWRFTRWSEQERHRPTLQAIFDEGRLHQPSIYARLEAMGFDVVREHDRPVQYRVRGATISGRPDGKVVGWRGHRYDPAYILEAKALSSYAWQRIRTVDDLRQASSHWTRSYYAQGQLYCLLEDLPHGLFVLKDKGTGLLKVVPYELDYAYAEDLLQRVERLTPAIVRQLDPEPISYDRNVCGDCGFRHVCYPARSYGEGASVITDPIMLEDLARREELKAASTEYRDLDESIKDRLKVLGVAYAVAGDFVIEGRQRRDGVIYYDIRKA